MKPTVLVLLGAALVQARVATPTATPELAQLWGQCGGFAYVKGNAGPTECVPGAYCKEINVYYAQCQPIPETQPTPSPA